MRKDWYFLFLSFYSQSDHKLRYKFVIDCIDLDLAGIVEFDKSLIEIDYTDVNVLMKLWKEENIKEIKPISIKLSDYNEFFLIISVYFILQYYHMIRRFPYETGFVNPDRPDEYYNNKDLFYKSMERFRKNIEIEKRWKIK